MMLIKSRGTNAAGYCKKSIDVAKVRSGKALVV